MSYCIKHNPKPNEYVSLPQRECETCLDNAFNPKRCKLCREKDGCEIADGLIICSDCEKIYFNND